MGSASVQSRHLVLPLRFPFPAYSPSVILKNAPSSTERILTRAFERVQQETGGPVGRRVRVPSDGQTFSWFTNLHELEAQLMGR